MIAQSGARLIEVGTTNRTRLGDYERALDAHEDVGAIMRVHQSNFRTVGFVEDVPVEALCELGVPVIDDIGSGCAGWTHAGARCARSRRRGDSVAAGAALVCCSGDKLLGGPQAGLIVGRQRRGGRGAPAPAGPRAADRQAVAGGARGDAAAVPRSATARCGRSRCWRCWPADEAELGARARSAGREPIGERATRDPRAGRVGGGALPLLELEGPAVALDGGRRRPLARALRGADPPVIARIHDGRVLLDPRTLTDEEVPLVAAPLRGALAAADERR